MNGLWLQAGTLTVRHDLPPPTLAPGEALVRVVRAGICGTDLELMRGYSAFAGIPGHEFVGVVESAAAPEWIGRRVVGEINVACGECAECRDGNRAHCARRTVLGIRGRDGAFADYLALPIANLHEVPAAASDDVAVFTEPLAAALRVQEQVTIEKGSRVAVIGAGRLGQLVARSLALTGCELMVMARHAGARQRLASMGIRAVGEGEMPRRWAAVAVDCTGSAEGLGIALGCLRPGGRLVLKSTYAGQPSLNLWPVVVDEITLIGSRCGPFGPALRLLAEGRLPVADLLEACYPFDAAAEAFAHAARPGTLKVLLRPA